MGRPVDIGKNVWDIREENLRGPALVDGQQDRVLVPFSKNLRNGKAVAITEVRYTVVLAANAVGTDAVGLALKFGVDLSQNQTAQSTTEFTNREDLFANSRYSRIVTVDSGDFPPFIFIHDYRNKPKICAMPLTWLVNVSQVVNALQVELSIKYYNVDISKEQFARFMSVYGKIPARDIIP